MNSCAIKEHKSNYPNPLEFRLHDQLEVGSEDVEHPGWIWVWTPDGNEGWAPKEYIEFIEGFKRGTAKSDYCARELDVKVGDRLQIENTLCGWHYVTNAQRENGWVPQDCVQSA